MTQFAFSMAAKIDDVDPMVLRLKAIAETVLDPNRVIAFEIAISEALTNVVRHAMAGQENGRVAIDLQTMDGRLLVSVSDTGTSAPSGFLSSVAGPDEVDQFAESGRGVGLMLACADSVEYASEDGINRLSMHFLNSAGSAK